MVQILFHKSNGVQSVSSFKILHDVAVYILFDLKYLIQTMKWKLFISFQMERILVVYKPSLLHFVIASIALNLINIQIWQKTKTKTTT